MFVPGRGFSLTFESLLLRQSSISKPPTWQDTSSSVPPPSRLSVSSPCRYGRSELSAVSFPTFVDPSPPPPVVDFFQAVTTRINLSKQTTPKTVARASFSETDLNLFSVSFQLLVTSALTGAVQSSTCTTLVHERYRSPFVPNPNRQPSFSSCTPQFRSPASPFRH